MEEHGKYAFFPIALRDLLSYKFYLLSLIVFY